MRSSRYEREICRYAETLGFHAERVAGSGRGRKSVCDVVLIKNGQGYLVEVKSTKDKTYYVSNIPETKKRLQELVSVSKKCGAIPLLAVRFKRKGRTKTWIVKKLTKELAKVNLDNTTLF